MAHYFSVNVSENGTTKTVILPEDSCTVEDLISQQGYSVGDRQILVNGEEVDTDYELEDDDQVAIVAKKFKSGLGMFSSNFVLAA